MSGFNIAQQIDDSFLEEHSFQKFVDGKWNKDSIWLHFDSQWWWCLDWQGDINGQDSRGSAWRPIKYVRELVSLYQLIEGKLL